MTALGEALARPLRVELPWSGTAAVGIPVDRLRPPARGAATVVLVILMVVGVAVAVASAVAAETDSFEALGTLGTELGAALWFAGALTWGARRNATVARGVLLALTLAVGVLMIAAALLLGWSGAALDLAMEFGVGMVAVPVIDVVLIGTLYQRLDAFGRGAGDRMLLLQVGGDAHPVRLAWQAESSPDRVT